MDIMQVVDPPRIESGDIIRENGTGRNMGFVRRVKEERLVMTDKTVLDRDLIQWSEKFGCYVYKGKIR